jgi:hypothetical protein
MMKMMKNHHLVFKCESCDSFHFTITNEDDENTLYRLGETPIEDCQKCVELHAFAEGLK